jgi:hypothetical protein
MGIIPYRKKLAGRTDVVLRRLEQLTAVVHKRFRGGLRKYLQPTPFKTCEIYVFIWIGT